MAVPLLPFRTEP